MAWDREKRGIFQRKQEKPQIKKHKPLNSEGNDGDITIRQLDDGVFLFFKALGKWYKTLNTASKIVPDPEVPGSLEVGVSNNPVKNMFVSSNSLHIGNQKANRIKLGVTGTGENVKLQVKTPSGKVVADENESLQTVDGDIDLSDTSITSYAIDTSVIEEGNTLTVGSGVEFNVVNTDIDSQSMTRDIESIQAEISTLKSELETTTNLAVLAEDMARFASNNSEVQLEIVDEIVACYVALHEAVSNFSVDGVNVINSSNDPYNSSYLNPEELPTVEF
tara:strand:+ start:1560 stop:2390 length:831 start_codon:yes stop_codon:yes gene_type:complete